MRLETFPPRRSLLVIEELPASGAVGKPTLILLYATALVNWSS